MSDADKASPPGLEITSDVKVKSFAPAEMVTCDACLRANPPTRANCFYCAASLPVTGNVVETPRAPSGEEPAQPTGVNPGFLVTLGPNQINAPAEPLLAAIATELQLRNTDVEIAFKLGHAVPLARVATSEQAAVLAEKLSSWGIVVNVLAEDGLNLDAPARKIRALEISADGLAATLLNDGGFSLRWEDLTLLVTGRLLINQVVVEERRRRGRSQPVGSRELFADEPVCDLFARSDLSGHRIQASSFDFSCLGADKRMTAFENFTTLIKLLQARASNAETDDSYRNLRSILGNIWPLEPQTRKGEWRRSGAGKVDVSTVTTTDNETQFNSYSRLRQRLRLLELEGNG